MDQSMEGKVAIVTGSSKGIGRAVAEQLGTRGARVVINARSPEHLAEVEAEMQSQGFDVLGKRAQIKIRPMFDFRYFALIHSQAFREP